MDFPAYQILSASDLADKIADSARIAESANGTALRFCFILGSGASVESKIESGGKLEMRWMNYLMEEDSAAGLNRAERTRRIAAALKKGNRLKYEFAEIERAWETAKAENGLGRHEEALADYSKAIELKPDYTKAYNNRGYALKQLGRYEEALDSFSRAIELNAKYIDAYRDRAALYRELGEDALAEADEEKAKALEAENRKP